MVKTGDELVVFLMSRDGIASLTIDYLPLFDSESGAVSGTVTFALLFELLSLNLRFPIQEQLLSIRAGTHFLIRYRIVM
jgi:hypothetical protein